MPMLQTAVTTAAMPVAGALAPSGLVEPADTAVVHYSVVGDIMEIFIQQFYSHKLRINFPNLLGFNIQLLDLGFGWLSHLETIDITLDVSTPRMDSRCRPTISGLSIVLSANVDGPKPGAFLCFAHLCSKHKIVVGFLEFPVERC